MDFYNSTFSGNELYKTFKDLINPLELAPTTHHKIFHPDVRKRMTVEMDLTDRCNLACPDCTFQNVRDKNDIDYYNAINLIDFLKRVGVQTITLCGGGEPTLWTNQKKSFGELIENISNKVKLGIISNGYELSDEKIISILKYCHYFRVSYNTFNTSKRQVEINEQVWRNINKLIRIKNKFSFICNIRVGIIVNPHYPEQLSSIIERFENLPIDSIQMRPLLKHINGIIDLDFELDNYKSFYGLLKKTSNDSRYNTTDLIEDILSYKTDSSSKSMCEIVKKFKYIKSSSK